jgi:hypothetical protein
LVSDCIQKEEEEEGKSGPKNAKKWKMKHATDTRYLFENDGEGMPRLLLLLRYQTQYTLCIFTLIGSGVDERIRYRVRLTTALQLALPTNGIMDFHLHTFDGACDATICALRYDVYLPVKMLTHKVHTVKFLSAII